MSRQDSPPDTTLMPRIAFSSSIVCLFLSCLMPGIQIAAAAELYRWTEADGSITFSPTRPKAGTSYETVGAKEEDTTPDDRPAEPAIGAAVRSQAADSVTATRQREPAGDPAAPNTSGRPMEEPRSTPTQSSRTSFPARQSVPDTALIADRGKSEHCRDLAKRVVSLERRLATDLTPRQMDDTVVYMARYQRNIDQFCPG